LKPVLARKLTAQQSDVSDWAEDDSG